MRTGQGVWMEEGAQTEQGEGQKASRARCPLLTRAIIAGSLLSYRTLLLRGSRALSERSFTFLCLSFLICKMRQLEQT